MAIVPIKITDKNKPNIIKPKLSLAAPTTAITLSKLKVISAIITLYIPSPKEALINAKKIISQTGCDAVKLEGGSKIIKTVKHLIKNEVQVMGHLGLLPQSEKGKFRFKGKSKTERNKILSDAKALSSSGVFSIVLECVEKSLAKIITNSVKVPTIGIGSSVHCDGQVLVTDDLLGLNPNNFRFVKKYANLRKIIDKSAGLFKKEVITKSFPKNKNTYQI